MEAICSTIEFTKHYLNVNVFYNEHTGVLEIEKNGEQQALFYVQEED